MHDSLECCSPAQPGSSAFKSPYVCFPLQYCSPVVPANARLRLLFKLEHWPHPPSRVLPTLVGGVSDCRGIDRAALSSNSNSDPPRASDVTGQHSSCRNFALDVKLIYMRTLALDPTRR